MIRLRPSPTRRIRSEGSNGIIGGRLVDCCAALGFTIETLGEIFFREKSEFEAFFCNLGFLALTICHYNYVKDCSIRSVFIRFFGHAGELKKDARSPVQSTLSSAKSCPRASPKPCA